MKLNRCRGWTERALSADTGYSCHPYAMHLLICQELGNPPGSLPVQPSYLHCIKHQNASHAPLSCLLLGHLARFAAGVLTYRPAHGSCSKCNHPFKRLDTHLQVSASCHVVADLSTSPLPPTSSAQTTEGVSATAGSTPTADHFSHPYSQPLPPTITTKPKLHLPKSDEDWEKANTF